MHRKLSLLVAGVLAGGVVTLGAASPAHACHELVDDGSDPVYQFVCGTAHAAPEPGPTIDYYYYRVTGIAHGVYCQYVSPHC